MSRPNTQPLKLDDGTTMPDPIIDRDAIIERAEVAMKRLFVSAGLVDLDAEDYAYDAARAALSTIAADLLAPIEALHSGKHWCGTDHGDYDWYRPEKAESCPTAQAVAAIREAVRA